MCYTFIKELNLMEKKKAKNHKKAGKAKGKLQDVLSFYSEVARLKKDVIDAKTAGRENDERLANLEIHMNLFARLLTTLCIEKFGIRAGALKRLVRRIENEAVRDSQIMELESLYKLSGGISKKTPPSSSKPQNDPWDQIS